MNRLIGVLIAGATVGRLGTVASAQPTRLTPNAKSTEEFSDIRGIRELPDGRILVSDYREQRVVLLDLEKGTVTPRVREGSGPLEARLPTALVIGPGDSTILVDLGNERLAVLDPEGRVRRTIPGDRAGIMGIRGIDQGGSWYFAIPGWMERTAELPNDSVRVVRWNPRTNQEETVAVIQGERMRSDSRSPALTPRIPTVGYGTRDAWLIDDRGRLRIVRGGNYSIETRATGAAPVIGPSYAYQTAPVTGADRVAYVRRFMLGSPTSGKGPDGGMGFSPPANDAEINRLSKTTEFAKSHPMFEAGRVVAEPGGRLWVGLPVGDGQPSRYDLFDDAGRRVASVDLPPRRRVMAVTVRSVYAIAETEDGIQFVERYSPPR